MSDAISSEWSVERVRSITVRIAASLADSDDPASQELAAAAALDTVDAESLLVMRSALVATRPAWEALEVPELVTQGRDALAAGKRLAIELPD